MKLLYVFIAFSVLFPSIVSAQDFNELCAKEIAAKYDNRALSDKGGCNTSQKQDTFIDEYNAKCYRITTLYENMDINKAYEPYIKNSTSYYFENNNNGEYKSSTWPDKLPKENNTLNYHDNEQLANVTLEYKYIKPKTVVVIYYNSNNAWRMQPYNKLTLEFKQEIKETYLTVTSEAFPVNFDCKKAGNATEKVICKAAEKGNFKEDTKLNYLYKALLRDSYAYNSSINTQDLQNSQTAWLKKRNQCKDDIKCIKQSYKTYCNEIEDLLNEQYAKDIQGISNCSPIHGIVWLDQREDADFINFKKCEYNGNILQTYKALVE